MLFASWEDLLNEPFKAIFLAHLKVIQFTSLETHLPYQVSPTFICSQTFEYLSV